ncbi:hypothetical protein BBJ28_00002968 [Nothophytophthora sp. Chile5]|nr:hypothetical protein BBJ28_00002968 [Nothophytophthora sp. Chile5]
MRKRRPDHFVLGVTCRSLGGVPSELRSRVWKELLGVARSERLCLDQSILRVEEDLANQRVISADASRTRGNELRFQQPETVELVTKLLTYYCKCRSIRYKQGMNEVLAPFLLLTEEREDSDEPVPLAEGVVFQCFYALIDRFLPHVFADREFRSLQCSFQLYRLLMLYHDPELCHFLDQHDMTPELYVTPWFMTLFARSLPPEFVFYLWDFFLLEEDPFLLHFVAYALVAAHRDRIFQADIAMLPQVLSSLTFATRDELEQACSSALALSDATPRSFKRDLYSVCYGGFSDAMAPFLEQLYACSSLQVYPDELVRNLLDRLASKAKEKHAPVLAPAAPVVQQLTSVEDALNPLLSPKSDGATHVFSLEHEEDDETAALSFIVLDCRPVEQFHECHLSLSYHVDPDIVARPDALDALMKGFARMKGCHFCFVGPSVATTPVLTRSSSNNIALNTIARLARGISSEKSQLQQSQEPVDKPLEVSVASEVAGEVPPSSSPLTPVALTRKQSPGEPGALAGEIGSSGAPKVHPEHLSVTRLVLMFLQKGFEHVSRLDGGFDELKQTIQAMDTFSQDQLLVASPASALSTEQVSPPDPATTSSSGGFNLFAKMGLSRSRAPSQDDYASEGSGSTQTDSSDASSAYTNSSTSAKSTMSAPSSSTELMKRTKSAKAKSSTSSAVSSLSHRLMLLKAAAKDVVSSTTSSGAFRGNNSIQLSPADVAEAVDDIAEERRLAGEEEWVEVCVKTREALEKSNETLKDVVLEPGPIGILFQKSRSSKTFQAVVDNVIAESQAAASGQIKTGDLLVAINGESLADVPFLSVIELVIEASRPVVLRFLSPLPRKMAKNKDDETFDAISIPPLAPTLVSATRHSMCITWDKLSTSAVARYQLQFARQSGDEFNPWNPVTMKQEGTTAEVDTTGVTTHTNGTMVGLDPGESLVFRVRCGDGQRWGPYSLSSGSMNTLDTHTAGASKFTSGDVTPTSMGGEGIATAVFLPGVCPEFVERGRFFFRVLLALRARRRPEFDAEKLDIVLEKGLIIQCCERLVCPGTNQIFVRLSPDGNDDQGDQRRGYEGQDGELMLLRNGQREADDDADGVWAFENTPDGEVVLERLPESTLEDLAPSSVPLQEQAKSMVTSFLTARGIKPPNVIIDGLSETVNTNSGGVIGSLASSTSSTSSNGGNAVTVSPAPVAPRILQVFPASSSEIVVTWDPVNDMGVTKYQIQYAKDRLAAMWWTVKVDIDADTLKYTVTDLQPNMAYLFRLRNGTEDSGWGPYSDSSASCRTLASGNGSANNSSSDEDNEAVTTRTASNDGKMRPSIAAMFSAPHSTPLRTGSTILDKAVAVASRLRRRSHSSNNPQLEAEAKGAVETTADGDEDTESHEISGKEDVEPPSPRYVNLASWKTSSSEAHKDFRFYRAVKYEEQREGGELALTRVGERELVVTPSVLLLLNVWEAPREGFALVEDWRPLRSLMKVAAQEELENSLVFHFKVC